MKRRNLATSVIGLILLLIAPNAFAQRTQLVSVNSAGTGSANSSSDRPVMSADERFIAFSSDANDLTANDANGKSDVFVHNRQSGVTMLVSINSAGTASGSGYSYAPAISADGRYVAFYSDADDLVAGDTNSRQDIFVRDLTSGVTKRLAIGVTNGAIWSPMQFSVDGRYLFFSTTDSGLVPNDTNNTWDIFRCEWATGAVTLISGNYSNTNSANNTSQTFRATPDGRFVVFNSSASDLVPNDLNRVGDVFVRDLTTGTTVIASVSNSGAPVYRAAFNPFISSDGRYVSFLTDYRLAINDRNTETDVYVRDLVAGTTTLASVHYLKNLADGVIDGGQMSADGRYVLMSAFDGHLVPNDNNFKKDVFVRDMQTGVTTSASLNAPRPQNFFQTLYFNISPNGRFVCFTAESSPFNPNYLYVTDMLKGTTSLVSVNQAGTGSGNGLSLLWMIGNTSVIFTSYASDLVSNDNNNGEDVFVYSFSRPSGDYDGDGKSDLAAWLPSGGLWSDRSSVDGSVREQAWGAGSFGDVPVAGDYDGDGVADLAVFRTSDSNWYILLSHTNALKVQTWGLSTDKPVPADYDGDAKTDLAVFRESTGAWFILQSGSNTLRAEVFGVAGDKTAQGDYDGDGQADLAVFRPSELFWYVLNSSNNSLRSERWGSTSDDKPVPGDYDGDGKTDIATYRSGGWSILRSTDHLGEEHAAGGVNYIPVPADYDGDGKTDAAAYADGLWIMQTTSDATIRFAEFGGSGATPVSSAYVVE
ncbi:MAG: VCBS repeat-containing protein [Acidobacteria bacterium]|nr:VCBS repeat-containing protein [Acidobacteriota bacterium]